MSMSESGVMGYMLVAHAFALISAGIWWGVCRCPCEETLRDAAFWTALVIAQTVVPIGLSVLHRRA